MMTFNIKKNSWHFWLQNFATSYKYTGSCDTDICTYTRRVMWGAFKLLVVSILVAFAAYCVGDFFYWIYSMIVGGTFLSQTLGAFITTVVLSIAVLGLGTIGAVLTVERVKEIHYERTKDAPPKQPSFLKLAYRKFKEKTCFKLTVVHDE